MFRGTVYILLVLCPHTALADLYPLHNERERDREGDREPISQGWSEHFTIAFAFAMHAYRLDEYILYLLQLAVSIEIT